MDQGTWTFQDGALAAAELPVVSKWLNDAAQAEVPTTAESDDDPTINFDPAVFGL